MQNKKRPMWHFPWRYKESIAFVLGIIIIGMVLQLTTGNINFHLFQAPINIILGITIIVVLIAFSFVRKSQIYQWFSGVPFSVTLIAGLLTLGIIMGLTTQVTRINPHDTNIFSRLGFTQMTTSWPFVLCYLLTLLSLGALIIRRLIAFKAADYAFYLNHIGLWIFLFAAGLGASDIKRYVMHIREGEVEWRVYSESEDVLELPIAIQLNDFFMEEYPPQLAIIDRENGDILPKNKPEVFQIDTKRPDGKLLDWQIHLDEYIHEAVRNSDSTYHEVFMPASSPAAKVTLKNKKTEQTISGWISAGNVSQLYMTLPLDSQRIVAMTQPSPKRFVSDINVFTEDGGDQHTLLEVNKPLRIGSWTLYQYGYDSEAGKMSTYTSIELVYDPWLHIVYLGIGLLALGSICLLWSGNKKGRKEK